MKPSATVEKFFRWLNNEALPYWASNGVDFETGGFVEQILPDGTPVLDVRRARLVARQIYAFHTAHRLGWRGDGVGLVQHGLEALLNNHISSDGVVIPRYLPATRAGEGDFDLYDQAFALFGLSYAARIFRKAEFESLALRLLKLMKETWSLSGGGFGETIPPRPPLKANPHMHLFEAAQAWMEISDAEEWRILASEIADLCLKHFIAPSTGALHEFFDLDWRIDSDTEIDVVEPGHQAEWAWLLIRWFRATGDCRYLEAARRLFSIAETAGVHRSRGRLVNELDAQLKYKTTLMRLWPQTERIKAITIFIEEHESAADCIDLEMRLDEAVASLMDYFAHPIAGAWWVHLDDADTPVQEPARASSLYHIMGAASELARATGIRLS